MSNQTTPRVTHCMGDGISATLSAADKTAILQNKFTQIEALLPFLIDLSAEEN